MGETNRSAQPKVSGDAKASLVFGILSCVSIGAFFVLLAHDIVAIFFAEVCAPVFAIAAIIYGHVGWHKINKAASSLRGKWCSAMGCLTGYGIIILIVISLNEALKPARRHNQPPVIVCDRNLRQIHLGILIWSADHDGLLPKSFLEMSNELSNPRILICPADTKNRESIKNMPVVWNPAIISYEFLTPGLSLSNLSNRPIVRCPIHGYELMGDGRIDATHQKN